MNEQRGEALSALLDGELDEQDRGVLLDRMADDAELRERWGRYSLIGDVMRGEAAAVDGLAGRVRAAVEAEPTVLAPPGPSAPEPSAAAWWKPVGGLALAAGLATVAVLGGRSMDRPDAAVPVASVAPPTAVAAAPAPPAAMPTAAVAGTTSGADREARWTSAERGVQERLDSYLVDYSGHAGGELRGMLPYARVVGYDGGRR